MTILGRFIGIDRHQSPAAPDLCGAGRDARALCALFTDSVPGIDARALLDENASCEQLRASLQEVFAAATPDDTVIFTFSGHGSHDHRLIAHDTDLDDWEATSIAMSDLAQMFRDSKAGSILCFLDCCFSGATPARVLEDSPASRDTPFDGATFGGTGRVMVTASGLDEPAYEHPTERHGLLTKALIEAALGADGALPVASLMESVIAAVRARAQTMGVVQTPVLFGKIDGGFVMPALRRGDAYFAEFPDLIRVPVGAPLDDLLQLGIPQEAVDAWKVEYPDGLNAIQQTAINEHGVLHGESLLTVAPTSSGKTFVGELAAIRAVADGRKAVFLLPYKALVNEKYEQFLSVYEDRMGARVVRCTGDYLDETALFLNAKYDIAVLTFEMFLSLAVGNPAVIHRLGLVVVDEAQFITDRSRGIVVELLLTYLATAKQRGIEPQVVALSATIGDLNHFHEWLQCATLIWSERPVPLVYGVMDRAGVFEHCTESGQEGQTQLLPPHAVHQRKQKASSQDVIVPLVRNLLNDPEADERVLIFRNTRGAVEGCAMYLANELGLPPAQAVIDALPTEDASTVSGTLRKALGGGTAFHSTNLSREERAAVEQAFRDAGSGVKVLVATSTVAAGINTPTSTVVIVEHSFPWENQEFTRSQVLNMAGRAGRLGYNESGRAVLLATTGMERRRLYEKYVTSPPEPVESTFSTDDLATWVVRLLAQVESVPRADVATLLANTYGGYLFARTDPSWQRRAASEIEALVSRMLDAELIEEVDGDVSLTLLGRACGNSSLAFESALRVVEMVREAESALQPMDLLALVQVLPEMDAQYTPLFKRGQKDRVWPGEIQHHLSPTASCWMRTHARDQWAPTARAKRLCILAAWIDGTTTEAIQNRFTINPFQGLVGPGDIRGIADASRFRLRSAYEIAVEAQPSVCPDPQEMDVLTRQLEVGIPPSLVPLLEMPLTLTRGEYLALGDAGITTADELWAAEPDFLRSILSAATVTRIEQHRPERNPSPV